MRIARFIPWTIVVGLVVVAFAAAPLLALPIAITGDQIIPTGTHEVHSGNGLLDYVLFMSANGQGVASNQGGGFNGDDANTDFPTGNGANKHSADETYITSFGDLRNFYNATFGTGNVDQIILALGLDQSAGNYLMLDTLDLISGFTSPTSDGRNDPFNNDITSATQNSTNGSIAGGTLLASLDQAHQLDVVNQGGLADYFILTGINPFDPAYQDTTSLAFHWTSTNHSGGGEKVFLSGAYTVPESTDSGNGSVDGDGGSSGQNSSAVPEPATLSLLGAAIAGLAAARRKSK